MGTGANAIRNSYIKTTSACLALVAAVAMVDVVALNWLPSPIGYIIVLLSSPVALAAAFLALAGAVVLIRYRRSAAGAPDLFLELNRTRAPAAIQVEVPARSTQARRTLARLLLGHEFIVGDEVEIRSWPEIRATLDESGRLEQLPFMPEMFHMCGQRARVFRCMHRLFDYRKSRRMRHMDGAVLLISAVCDGSKHGGCQAACHTIWKAAWLRRAERSAEAKNVPAASLRSHPQIDVSCLQLGTHAPRYSCQLTQLHHASEPLDRWGVANFLRPLVAGNVTIAAFGVGWLTYLFNELQQMRKGVAFPAFESPIQGDAMSEEAPLVVGEEVVVRSSGEIRATLNDQLMHHGLWLEPDMLKYCGRRCRIQADVKSIIDIVTGEMLTMKTPAYMLRDVHFSGERQLFNAQYEPLFWRAVWLRRARD
jgi:hypothetical protein